MGLVSLGAKVAQKDEKFENVEIGPICRTPPDSEDDEEDDQDDDKETDEMEQKNQNVNYNYWKERKKRFMTYRPSAVSRGGGRGLAAIARQFHNISNNHNNRNIKENCKDKWEEWK